MKPFTMPHKSQPNITQKKKKNLNALFFSPLPRCKEEEKELPRCKDKEERKRKCHRNKNQKMPREQKPEKPLTPNVQRQ